MKLTPWMLTVGTFGMIALLAVGFIVKKLTAGVEMPVADVSARTLPMAITGIEPGTTITRAHVGNGPWRADADLEPDTLTTVDGVVGRVARERILAAQPLRGSQFYAPGEFPDLEVAEGMRAVSVNVGNDTAMVSGLIKPGQYVDVHLTVNRTESSVGAADGGNETITVTLFEGVRVLAVNRNTVASARGEETNVTLELNRTQTRMLLLGADRGSVALTFNPDGRGAGSTPSEDDDGVVTLDEILGLKSTVANPPFRTENYRGSSNMNLYFQNGERIDGGGYGGDSSGDGGGVSLHRNNGDDWTSLPPAAATADRTAQRRPTESR